MHTIHHDFISLRHESLGSSKYSLEQRLASSSIDEKEESKKFSCVH